MGKMRSSTLWLTQSTPRWDAHHQSLFRPGDLINEETQFQADFTYEMENEVLLAFGATYLDEAYEVVEGEPDSYRAGPHSLSDPFGFCNGSSPTAAGSAVIANGSTLNCADSDDPVYTVVGMGSNGFPGYSPQFLTSMSEARMRCTPMRVKMLQTHYSCKERIRYEDYDDFDSEAILQACGAVRFN